MSGPRLAVKALLLRGGQVLMNHIVDPDGRDVYTLPGGGQEHGESQPEALVRECAEEIGARVTVHQVACLFEVRQETRLRDGAPIPLFHQVNVAYWCGLEDGEEPAVGSDPDPGQVGTRWLPIERLGEFAVHPPELSRWLRSDPSARPISLGVTT